VRILHVGNGNYNHLGNKYYDVGRKLNNGLIRNGHNVYFLSDRDTSRASNILHSRKLGIKACNKIFLEICNNFKPEFILLGHADIIKPESLEQARLLVPEVRIAQFNVDPIFRECNIKNIKSKLAFVDATFITTAGEALRRFSSSHGTVTYMPNPIDSSIECEKSHERSDQENDIFWALRALKGSFPGDERIDIPLFLEAAGDIKISYHGMNEKPMLFGADYYNMINNTKMGLNISVVRTAGNTPIASNEEIYLYSSDRISHYMGAGLLTFTTRNNSLDELFEEDKEIIFFSDKDELIDKIRYYKKHDTKRKEIARAGWKKSHENYNEQLIARYIIETTMGQEYTHNYAWPVTQY